VVLPQAARCVQGYKHATQEDFVLFLERDREAVDDAAKDDSDFVLVPVGVEAAAWTGVLGVLDALGVAGDVPCVDVVSVLEGSSCFASSKSDSPELVESATGVVVTSTRL